MQPIVSLFATGYEHGFYKGWGKAGYKAGFGPYDCDKGKVTWPNLDLPNVKGSDNDDPHKGQSPRTPGPTTEPSYQTIPFTPVHVERHPPTK